ncbi:MAG TPA: heme-binding protein [Spirochaetia bacterium]|nr:heme-binding protein [Spirochaetia bacterium]
MELALAQQAMEQAVKKAQDMGVPMSLAVVDEGGHLVMCLRMDGAGWLTTDIAKGKAYTAAAFRRSTAELAERLGSHPSFLNAINALQPGVMAVGGGVPMVRDGKVIGGIGASGGTAAQDEECARAGLAGLLD